MASIKKCSSCQNEKSINEFYRDYSIVNSIGYRAKCKDCVKIFSKHRKQNDKTEIKTKTCNLCNTVKTIDNFYKSTRHLDGYFLHCKECHQIKLDNVGHNQRIKRTPEYMKEYWKKRFENTEYKMKQNIKRYISSCAKRNNYSKNNTTTKYIGCSIEFFIKWIEFQFNNEMTWNNHSTYWELDHVKPCSSFDLSNDEEISICFNWKNYQPLHKNENRMKSNKIIIEYFIKQEEAINQFLLKYKNIIDVNNNYYKFNCAAPCG